MQSLLHEFDLKMGGSLSANGVIADKDRQVYLVNSIMEEAINLYNELRDKVSAKVDGNKKAYFNSLRKEILEKTDALYTKLSEAVRDAVAE